jgi:acyl carrier protein
LSQGMDSLMATNLARAVERVFGVKLRLEDLLLGASAAQTAAKIADSLAEQENEEEIVI